LVGILTSSHDLLANTTGGQPSPGNAGILSTKEAAVVSLVPVPEVREMVEVARRFVAVEVHYSWMVGPTAACRWWAKVHGSHPAIVALATEWQLLADRVWNKWG
jgi:hypothetical protein